jgi:hypothetical protein
MIPNLPTDNLYKFLFIGGFALVITSVILFNNSAINLTNRQLELFVERENQRTGNDYGFVMSSELGRMYWDKYEATVKKMDSARWLQEWDNNTVQEMTKFLKDFNTERAAWIKENNLVNNKVKLLDKKLEDAKWWDNIVIFSSALMFILGISFIGFGGRAWYILLQKPADEKIQLELVLLKAEVAKLSTDGSS